MNLKFWENKKVDNVVADSVLEVPKKFVSRISDNLQNVLTKAAARHRDVTNPANNFYDSPVQLDYSQLENIYISVWVGKKIVDMPIEYMFKNGFDLKIKGQEQLEKDCLKYFEEHDLLNKLKRYCQYKKIYGGSIIFPKDRYQDPSQPYNFAQFYKRDIEWVVRDVTYMAVVPYTEITSEKYFQPYMLNLVGVQILADNVILGRGIQVPLRRIPSYRYMGMSIYQNILQAMISDEYVSKGIVNMIYRNNMKYYFLDGLDATVKQGGEDLVLQRIGLIEDNASIMSAALIDAKDRVEFVSQAFNGLDKIDNRSLTRLSAASNIPAVVLLGSTPDNRGLGNSQAGEFENFFNYIENEQREVDPELKQIFTWIAYILTGKEHDIEVNLRKPHTISPKEQEETNKLILENMQAQQALGIPDDMIVDYAVQAGLLTTDQGSEITELKNEMFKMAEFEAENDKSETNSNKE